MDFFAESDYRVIIQALVRRQKESGKAITYERLARSAGVQKAHITNVLKGRAAFQQDQIFMIAKELEVSSDEAHYLMLLLDFERSSIKARKDEIWAEIEALQAKYLQTDKHIHAGRKISENPENTFPDYYLNPIHQIIHIAISIDRFSRNLDLMREALGLSAQVMNQAIKNLDLNGLIEKRSSRYFNLKRSLHLPRNSSLYFPWRFQLQNLALLRTRNLTEEKSYGFSATFSANEATRKKILSKIMKLLKEVETEVTSAPAENIYHLSIDILPWTDL